MTVEKFNEPNKHPLEVRNYGNAKVYLEPVTDHVKEVLIQGASNSIQLFIDGEWTAFIKQAYQKVTPRKVFCIDFDTTRYIDPWTLIEATAAIEYLNSIDDSALTVKETRVKE